MKMTARLAICFLCIFVGAAYAETGSRYVERAGGYSLQAPKGWEFREFPGLKYQIAFGPQKDSFSPNINVVDEAYSGPLKSYVDLNIETLKKLFVQLEMIGREAFVTASGLKGERVITTSLQQKNLLRQTFYFFPGPSGKYLVVTCSALAKGGEVFDPLFAESLKTLELLK
jgi:hypothetical protein